MKRLLPIFLILGLFLACVKEPEVIPEVVIPVTGVSLSPERLELFVDDSTTLTASVIPADATDTTLLWSSSNFSVVSVSGKVITALAPGEADITVTTRDGGFQATCRVNVTYYQSSDYSRDGEVVCLQEATQGLGINIIFLGDGFTDRDMEPGGRYERIMREWMEQFFVYEPYRSFRNRFNVFTVKVVSRNASFKTPGSDRRLSEDLTDGKTADFGNALSLRRDVCHTYANRVPNPRKQGLKICVFTNARATLGRSFCSYAPDYCLALILSPDRALINHELGGHGLGHLGDEYVENQQYFTNTSQIADMSAWGAYSNLDLESDPEKVRWAHFLKDPRYAEEGLGVFEGGALYAFGIYRPSMNSLMNSHGRKGAVFNAPSREAIYKNIMHWSAGPDWTYDYEEFVKADEAGRKQAVEYAATTRSFVADENGAERGLPPIYLDDDSVKEIRVTNDGTITLIR